MRQSPFTYDESRVRRCQLTADADELLIVCGEVAMWQRCFSLRTGDTTLNLLTHVPRWLADLRQQADAGEFLYSLNDYAVLLRTPD
jgi:hypothetical protein